MKFAIDTQDGFLGYRIQDTAYSIQHTVRLAENKECKFLFHTLT